MKSILIIYEQALQPEIKEMMRTHNVLGFTQMQNVGGKGSRGGEPHLGTHAWPALNDVIFIVVEDQKVQPILDTLKQIDHDSEILGIRAFVWNIENSI
jgi:nitrogen regulatory protein PII